jgi:hypothetical protein
MGFLTYKAVGSTGPLSDGEEGYLPVLPRRILVTESLPLPIRGPETKKFEFAKLLESGQSDSLRHQSLTVQMVSNPSWYAVMALPYLMEFPHQCTEQTFNRLYANSLARHIAMSDPEDPPRVRPVEGHAGAGQPAGEEPGSEGGDAGRDAVAASGSSESQARRNVGILFDDNRLNDETARLLQNLAECSARTGVALVPRRPAQRLHHAVHHHRLRPPAAPGRGHQRRTGVKSLQRLDDWIDGSTARSSG